MDSQPEFVTTGDGVRIALTQRGEGPPLMLIPGWSQTAAQYRHQLDALSLSHHVVALDLRGHGASDKPVHGYRIQRLAADLGDVIDALGFERVSLLGHSMGCSVIWSYLDLFGDAAVERLVLVDQSPALLRDPVMDDTQAAERGALFTHAALSDLCRALRGPDAADVTRDLIDSMLTADVSPQDRAWMLECNLQLPREHAATLLFNHCCQDWRDVIRRIRRRTLVIGGRVSLIPWQSQAWIHQQVAGSELVIFEQQEGGQHFMFYEGATRFNELVAAFLA